MTISLKQSFLLAVLILLLAASLVAGLWSFRLSHTIAHPGGHVSTSTISSISGDGNNG